MLKSIKKDDVIIEMTSHKPRYANGALGITGIEFAKGSDIYQTFSEQLGAQNELDKHFLEKNIPTKFRLFYNRQPRCGAELTFTFNGAGLENIMVCSVCYRGHILKHFWHHAGFKNMVCRYAI